MTTPLDALIAALHEAASYNAAAEAPPETVVWCDAAGEFLSILPSLRERLPELLTYGEYDPATRTGPAVWIRGVLAGAVSEVGWPDSAVPILYLPGIGREVLKGAEDCPQLLQPLVWFTVAGNLFGHVNGKDWTLRGFLAADRGALRLNIADDSATRAALAHAAARFCIRPVEELRNRRWDADAFNVLLAPDLDADMLDWMNGGFTEKADTGRFAAFANIADKELRFDPRKLSRQDAAGRLAQRKGKWNGIWNRFASSTGYEGIVQLLAAEEPTDLLADKAPFPKVNAQEEKALREALAKLADVAPAEAAARIQSLEITHAWRRDTVWGRRGQAPLAYALAQLALVADAKALPAHDGAALAEAYAEDGAQIDRAAMAALAAAPRELDRVAVTAALRVTYLPWLDDGAHALQELVRIGKVRLSVPSPATGATTILFVDGLRMDLAQELVRVLSEEGLAPQLRWCWSGFPTVTATCKPLVSPVAQRMSGSATTTDVLPHAPDGKAATKPVLFKLMESEGWATGDALLAEQKLWTESGRFDEEGHALGARLAERLAAGIRDAADHVLQLVRSGRNVRIVTDHGWLLMPGGLPQAALDVGLVEPQGKRTRCAMVKPKAQTSYLQIPWSWNADVFVATASGVRCFYASQEYSHGGVSPQECVLPIIEIASKSERPDISIVQARWEGLRLRIEVQGGADSHVDLRLGAVTSGPSLIKGGRVLDESGRTSVLVSDEHEGATACLVILDDDGRVRAHRTLTVGGE
ncbi:BREX-1 system phosphatase PglZ type B [Mesorhizobium sophorae]|uniref:BREX-1 system phosphatase PglZ type B n=1 Tax=Mesorhizobium sophorae TaxID=1300294 RepID=UPI000BA2E3BF|nr:BREX-1 system phosphatase PglZ type B [Mesorhizobium sophorae]